MTGSQHMPSNWSRTFTIWINDIQVQFQAQSSGQAIWGGVLQRLQAGSRLSAILVAALFCLHCTRPQVVIDSRAGNVSSGIPSQNSSTQVEYGDASWYGAYDDVRLTANGDVFDPGLRTCAHRSLPFGTLLEVENRVSRSKVLVRVNDRGPFVDGRILDVTPAVASELGFSYHGVTPVRIRVVVPSAFSAAKVVMVGKSFQSVQPSLASADIRTLLDEEKTQANPLQGSRSGPSMAAFDPYQPSYGGARDGGSRSGRGFGFERQPFIARED